MSIYFHKVASRNENIYRMLSHANSSEMARNVIETLEVNNCGQLLKNICLVNKLMEVMHIGATTYFQYRVEVDGNCGPLDLHSPDFYAIAATGLPGEMLGERYRPECYIGFRITEDSGYISNIPLTPAMNLCEDFKPLFRNRLSTRKLKGKFNLEVLFVDAEKIGNRELCEKYVANINSKEKNPSFSLKDKVKTAEKWLGKAGKNRIITKTLPPNVEPKRNIAQKFQEMMRTDYIDRRCFPCNNMSEHFMMMRTHVSHPLGVFAQKTNLTNIYAFHTMELFKIHCFPHMKQSSYTMFEFQTNDGHLAKSKLRRHDLNSCEILQEAIREHRIPCESFSSMYTVTIYCVDIPHFAPPRNVMSRINFIRKASERLFVSSDVVELTKRLPDRIDEIRNRRLPPPIVLNQCTKPLEENCTCEKLHLSDYCTLLPDLEKRSDRMITRHWGITLSEWTMRCYRGRWEANLYVMIANRICQNTFSKDFEVGTNIIIDMGMRDERVYSSERLHHSDVGEKSIVESMFNDDSQDKPTMLAPQRRMRMPTNAYVYLDCESLRFVGFCGKYELFFYAEINRSLEKKLSVTPEHPPNSIITFVGGVFPRCTLNSSYFKIGSSLADKASTDLLKLSEAYEVISARATIDTTKSKICLFLVEIDCQFHRDALSPVLLLANICLDIVSQNEVLLGKKKKITVKFHLGNNLVQVVLNEKYRWNETLLLVDMCKESIRTIEVPKKFYLEVHYRLMQKKDIYENLLTNF